LKSTRDELFEDIEAEGSVGTRSMGRFFVVFAKGLLVAAVALLVELIYSATSNKLKRPLGGMSNGRVRNG